MAVPAWAPLGETIETERSGNDAEGGSPAFETMASRHRAAGASSGSRPGQPRGIHLTSSPASPHPAMSATPLVPSPAMVTTLSTWSQAGLVAVGGTVGCLARWRAGVWLNTMPWPIAAGTLFVNVVGGLCIGFSLVAFARAPSEFWRLLLVTGFLGGMTTFSAFTGESLSLLVKGQFAVAAFHTGVHVFGSLAAAAVGWQIGRWVLN